MNHFRNLVSKYIIFFKKMGNLPYLFLGSILIEYDLKLEAFSSLNLFNGVQEGSI